MNGRALLAWMRRNRLLTALLGGGLLLLVFMLVNSSGEQEAPMRVVEVTRLVPVTVPASPAPEVTRVVVVTPTPEPVPIVNNTPGTLQQAVVSGPLTLDPAQAGDPAGAIVLRNVLETLVYPDPLAPGDFLPLLATDWEVDEQGLQVTFELRRGVRFSNGAMLTAGDVAYSLQRLLLQSEAGRPQAILLEPLFGFRSGDVTEGMLDGPYLGNRAALMENTTEQERVEPCERVQAAILADEDEGTVTIVLAEPWAPLLAILSQPWTGVISREWAAARGDWDGSCANWSNWYGQSTGEGPLSTTILGTGPYVLDHWTPGSEYVLRANPRYWRSDQNPMWPDGPAGPPSLETVRVVEVTDDALRWELLRDGNVATAPLSAPARLLAEQLSGELCDGAVCIPGPAPAEPLRRMSGPPAPEFLALAFNFNIPVAGNPFVGSGELDGEGIPAAFFADLHVRRAFAFCFDEAAYLGAEVAGTVAPGGTLLPPGWATAPGYPYLYDRQSCDDELLLAWENQLPATGFRLQIPYLAGDEQQHVAATLLQARLQEINAGYQVETVGLPAETYRQALANRQLPIAFVRWEAPLFDPHYYVAPLLTSDLEQFQRPPAELQERMGELLAGGLSATTLEERREQYRLLEALWQAELPFLPLPRPATATYQQRWLVGWLPHPEAAAPYYYAYAQQGATD